MKNNTTQQEILLMTGTTFSSRQLCEKDDTGKLNHFTEIEKLEEACWSGLLREMLPDIFEQPDNAKMLYLWQVREGASFIELELGEFPTGKDNYYSIDPYSFLKINSFN